MTDPKPSQVDKFKNLTREIECDDDEQRFDERLEPGEVQTGGEAGVRVGIVSVLLVAVLVGAARYLFDIIGAGAALPVAVLISIGTEEFVSRDKPFQSTGSLRRRR